MSLISLPLPCRRFNIGPFDLRCHEMSLRRDERLEYDHLLHERAADDCIFFGPYIALLPGVCVLKFDGELDGELDIGFVHASGNQSLRRVTITSFEQPLCLVVPQWITDFEIQARRTATLKQMTLRSIAVEHLEIDL